MLSESSQCCQGCWLCNQKESHLYALLLQQAAIPGPLAQSLSQLRPSYGSPCQLAKTYSIELVMQGTGLRTLSLSIHRRSRDEAIQLRFLTKFFFCHFLVKVSLPRRQPLQQMKLATIPIAHLSQNPLVTCDNELLPYMFRRGGGCYYNPGASGALLMKYVQVALSKQ